MEKKIILGQNRNELKYTLELIEFALNKLTSGHEKIKTIAGTINTKTDKKIWWSKADSLDNMRRSLVRLDRRIRKALKK